MVKPAWRPGWPPRCPTRGHFGQRAVSVRGVGVARAVLGATGMSDFSNLDRCAAYVAIQSVAGALPGVARSWPALLADRARSAAVDALQATAEAVAQPPGSPGRRRCARDALTAALAVVGALDAAVALGLDDDDVASLQYTIGRAIALLAMLLHATTAIGTPLPPPRAAAPPPIPAPKTTPGRVSHAHPAPPRLTRPVPTQLLRR
jgi:hypothetical protein